MPMSKSKMNLWKRQQDFYVCAGIILITTMIYIPSMQGGFYFDDQWQIISNQRLKVQTFNTSALSGLLLENRPVTYLTFALNYYFDRLHPFSYRLVNLIVHLAVVICVYYFTLMTLNLAIQNRENHSMNPKQTAGLITLFWAIHPVHVAAVAYIVQRATLMAALFSLLSLIFYIKARQAHRLRQLVGYYGVSLMAFLLALGSKEIAVNIPFILLLYDAFFISRFRLDRLKKVMIFYVLAFSALFVVLQAQGKMASVWDILQKNYAMEPLGMKERLLTEFRVVTHYISIILLPHPSRLNLDYDFSLSQSLFNPVTTLLSLLIIVGMILFSVRYAKIKPLISFWILWFLGNLVLESTILKLDLVFEHRLYLPSLGLISIAVFSLTNMNFKRWYPSDTGWNMAKASLLATIVVLTCFWTYQRCSIWSDEVALWKDTIEKSPNKSRPHLNLGTAYKKRGQMDLAEEQFQEAIRLQPRDPEALTALAHLYSQTGRQELAIKEYETILSLQPKYLPALIYLSSIYNDHNRREEALKLLLKAQELQPSHRLVRLNLGRVYSQLGQYNLAIDILKEGVSAEPAFTPFHEELASIYQNLKQTDEAIRENQFVLKLNPRSFKAHYSLGLIYHGMGRLAEAGEHYREAIRLDPKHLESINNLGTVYALQGSIELAIREFEKVLALSPEHYAAKMNLSRALQIVNKDKMSSSNTK
jgi:tetratricopeptide (TPR) repeat protein